MCLEILVILRASPHTPPTHCYKCLGTAVSDSSAKTNTACITNIAHFSAAFSSVDSYLAGGVKRVGCWRGKGRTEYSKGIAGQEGAVGIKSSFPPESEIPQLFCFRKYQRGLTNTVCLRGGTEAAIEGSEQGRGAMQRTGECVNGTLITQEVRVISL